MRIVRQSVLFLLLSLTLALTSQAQHDEFKSRPPAELVAQLQAPDAKVRSSAAVAIGRLGCAAAFAVPNLAAALGDSDMEVRGNAAWALAQMGKEATQAVPALEKALGDASWRVRGRAAVALGNLGADAGAAQAALRRALEDTHTSVRAAATGALWAVTGDGTEPMPALKKMLTDSNAETRKQAAQALARVGAPAAVMAPELMQRLYDDDAGVRLAVATALMPVGQGNQDVRKALEKRLALETTPTVREAMRSTLEQLQARPVAEKLEQGVAARGVTAAGPALEQETVDKKSVVPAAAAEPSGGVPPDAAAEAPGSTGASESAAEGETAEPRAAASATGGDATRERAPEPTYEGRSLSEWITQLGSKDVGERRLAAVALGEIGPAARPAVGPLNQARLYDNHDMVRHQAALALARILGVALGDLLPQPRRKPGQGRETATIGPPPEGRIFYLFGVHTVSERGAEPRPDLTRRDTAYRQFLFGFTNGALNYLDLAESHKYREDAQKRGLDVSVPLPELLQSEPEAERNRILKEYKFFYKYKNDYIVRITCNQQTRYAYYRWIGDQYEAYGSGSHWAMTPGKFVAEITVWVRDGFRLDFKVPFTCAPEVYTADGDYLQAAKAGSPKDLAKEEREYEASITPGNTDYSRRTYPAKKASAAKVIGDRIGGILQKLGNCQPIMPDGVVPYIEESLAYYDKAVQIEPKGHKPYADDLSRLVQVCSMASTRETYALGVRLTSMVEKLLTDPELKASEAAFRSAHHGRAVCYATLAELALSYQMDIPTSLRFRLQTYQSEALAEGAVAGTLRKTDVEKKMTEWPQPGWWDPAWDELQPPSPAELTGEKDEGDGEEKTDETAEHAPQLAPADAEKVDAAVAEVDAERSEQAAWFIDLRRKLSDANSEVSAAESKLVTLRRTLLAIEQKMNYFGSLLSQASARPADAEWLEEQIFVAIKDSEAIKQDLAGKERGGAEGMRKVLEKLVDDLAKRQAQLEGERDAIIQDTLLNYASVAQSLEKRGPECSEPKIREAAENALKVLRNTMHLCKAQLYTAAGMSSEFREAARECIAAGGQDFDYQVRLMESAHMESEGQLSLAIKAARLALDARKESAEPVREELPDGTVVSRLTPAQALVKRLELKALEGITAKTAQDSAVVRKLCEEQIGVHGENGVKGFAYDVLFMGRFISARGDNSIVDTFYNWVTGPAGQPFGGTPLDKEDTLAGKPESLAREMGMVLDDATRTTLGLTMIRKLREHDVPFSQIKSMNAAKFRDVVAGTLGREPNGDKWRNLSDAQVLKMRSELHFAMQHADVERLVEGTSQILDLETGRSYYDTESFTGNWRDVVEDQANVVNLLLFALPNAQVAKAGRQVGFLKWAQPAVGGSESIALKQAFAETIGVGRALQWVSKHELGARLVTDLVDTHSRMTWFGKAATDAMLQYDATQAAKYGTEYVVGELGYDKATQEKAGRVAEVVSQIGTSFVMDLDVTVSIAKDVLNPSQARVVVRSLGEALESADEMREIADSPRNVLRKALAETDGGRITAENQRLAKAAVEQLEAKLESLRKALPAPADAHPVVNEHYDRLQALYEGLQAAADGMPAEAKQFSAFAEELSEKLAQSRTSLVQQVAVMQSASAPRATKQDLAAAPTFEADDLNFRKPSALPIADQLVQRQEFKRAAKLYEAGYYVYDELGMGNDSAAQMLAKRWRAANQLDKARGFFERMKATPDPNVDMARPVTDAEVAAIRNAPDLKITPIGKGASDPCWVEVGGKRVGIFKPAHPQFPFGREGEDIGAKLAEKLDIPYAAVTRTSMPLTRDVGGTFARYFEAAEATGQAWRSTVDDLLQLKQAKGLRFIPVGPEAPDTFWAVSEGKRVGIFTPDYARLPHGAGVEDVFERVVKATGGEVLDTVPTKMPMTEADGTFVRYIEGKDLMHFTDAERIVLKREIAKEWVARLMVGDYDAHALNFKIGADGKVMPIDHNLADVLEIRRGTLETVLGTPTLSTDPVAMEQEIEKLMRHRLKILCGGVTGDNPHYQCMGRVAEQMTFEDFATPLEKVQQWDRAFFRELLGNTFGDQTERALDVLEARARCLKRVLESFPTVAPPKVALRARFDWPARMRQAPKEAYLLAA